MNDTHLPDGSTAKPAPADSARMPAASGPTPAAIVPAPGAAAPTPAATTPAPAAVTPAPAAATPAAIAPPPASRAARRSLTASAVIVTVVITAIVLLSAWYLLQPQPLLVQGEVDATRIDIAARVDGRIREIPVKRGEDIPQGKLLVGIDNPELLARLREAELGKAVAVAELARIDAGTRAEIVAVRKAGIASATAAVTLAQQTYDRTKVLAEGGHAPIQRLDEATAALQVAQRTLDQARLAYDEAVAGFTREERQIANANVVKAQATVETLKSLVDQLAVVAPAASQVYQINAEAGEVVLPGVPLLSLVDLGDVWLRFELREDLIKNVKIGDRFDVRIPALGDRHITVEVKLIASRGEYAGWRATRATGDFDLRTFAVRAYPVERIAELRPGMSAYTNVQGARR